jgi:hypothetical protein
MFRSDSRGGMDKCLVARTGSRKLSGGISATRFRRSASWLTYEREILLVMVGSRDQCENTVEV